MALLAYRSTPFPWCNRSPGELLMGRRIRANIPQIKEQLVPEWKFLEEFRRQNKDFKEKQKRDYDRRHRTLPLSPIPDETDVWITSGTQPVPGRVVLPANTPRSYLIDTPSGRVRRNRQHLNVMPDNTEHSDSDPSPNRIMTRSQTGTAIRPPDRF